MLSMFNGSHAAQLFVGMYLIQGFGSLFGPSPVAPAPQQSKKKKSSSSKKKKQSDEICYETLMESIHSSFGSIIMATGIVGFCMLFMNWNVQLALGLSQTFTCIMQLYSIISNGNYSLLSFKKSSSSASSNAELNGEWMSILLTALPAYACLMGKSHALDWTRIVAASWFINGIQCILDPSKGIASFAANRGLLNEVSTSWITATTTSSSSSSLLPTTSNKQRKQQRHHRHVLTMFSTLSLWQLNYSTVLFCLAQGLGPAKAIGCGSIFGIMQLLSFLNIADAMEIEDCEYLREYDNIAAEEGDVMQQVPRFVFDAFAVLFFGLLAMMLFL